MHLSVSPELERLISEQAQSLGYSSTEEYLRAVLGHTVTEAAPRISDEEFEQILEDLSAEENLPGLPSNFSRADIYSDHD